MGRMLALGGDDGQIGIGNLASHEHAKADGGNDQTEDDGLEAAAMAQQKDIAKCASKAEAAALEHEAEGKAESPELAHFTIHRHGKQQNRDADQRRQNAHAHVERQAIPGWVGQGLCCARWFQVATHNFFSPVCKSWCAGWVRAFCVARSVPDSLTRTA